MNPTTDAPPPEVSVLLPAYNAERYVERSVRSILGQTFDRFELLIVDDGSSDRTGEILESLARTDPRIRLTRRENLGLVASLNELIGRARAPLLARMDADDIAEPTRFEREVAYLAEHPDCVLVGSRVTLIDPDDAPLCTWIDAFDHDEIVGRFLDGQGQIVVHPTVIMRADAVRALGGYRAEYFPTEDLDLFLRLAEVGRLANLPESLLRYRDHATKIGHRLCVRQGEAARRTLIEAHRRRGLEVPASVRDLEFRPSSATDRHRTWAWWALGAGHLESARKHALALLARRPFSPDSWRVFCCVLRGY